MWNWDLQMGWLRICRVWWLQTCPFLNALTYSTSPRQKCSYGVGFHGFHPPYVPSLEIIVVPLQTLPLRLGHHRNLTRGLLSPTCVWSIVLPWWHTQPTHQTWDIVHIGRLNIYIYIYIYVGNFFTNFARNIANYLLMCLCAKSID